MSDILLPEPTWDGGVLHSVGIDEYAVRVSTEHDHWEYNRSEGRVCIFCGELISNGCTTCRKHSHAWGAIKADPYKLAAWLVYEAKDDEELSEVVVWEKKDGWERLLALIELLRGDE